MMQDNLILENAKLPKVVVPVVSGEACFEKQYLCTYCRFCFNSEKDLVNHLTVGIPGTQIKKVSEKVSYVCRDCRMTFNSFFDVNQHYDKIHLKLKIFSCPTCDKSFKDKHALKFHTQQVHDSSKRVKCESCLKTYFNKYSLKIHLEKCQKQSRS